MNKNTTVPDHAIGDFKDDVRAFLFHAKIAALYAQALMRNRAVRYLSQNFIVIRIIIANAHRLHEKIRMVEHEIGRLHPGSYTENALLDGLLDGLDVNGDKLNNIAVVTGAIQRSHKDYTARIDFAFNSARQEEILKKYWIAAKGSAQGFKEYHSCSKELNNGYKSMEVAC